MKVGKQNIKKYCSTDADGLYNLITTDWESVYSDCRIVDISIVKDGLWYAFVVFEAEIGGSVKHGKWIKDRERDMLRCSACEDFYVDMWLYWYNHCPNCGARMDGE